MKAFLSAILLFVVQCGTDVGVDVDKLLPKNQLAKLLPITKATARQIAKKEVAEGSYIVAFWDMLGDQPSQFLDYRSEAQGYHLAMAESFFSDPRVKNIQYLTSVDFDVDSKTNIDNKSPLFLDWKPQQKKANIASIVFSDNEAALETLEEWYRDGLIWYAEPNYISRLFQTEAKPEFQTVAETYEAMTGGASQNAPWLSQIKVVEAFKQLATPSVDTSNPPLIAIMDSGADYLHPQLKENIWQNSAVNLAGCLDDYVGCNTTQVDKGVLGNGDVFPMGTTEPGQPCPSNENSSTCKHGTHVAGLVAAKPTSGYGGVCPICTLVIVKIVGKSKQGIGDETGILDSSIIAGMTYISRFKQGGSTAIRLVNGSFGKFQRSRSVEVLIRLLKSVGEGVLVIAAAGNEDTMNRAYPAAYDDVVAVVNITSDKGTKAKSSNYGVWTDIAAPGDGPCPKGTLGLGVESTVPGGDSDCLVGTSMASPVVTGVAGLALLADPTLTYDQLRNRLLATADPGIYEIFENDPFYPKIKSEPRQIPLLGQGIVDAQAAVTGTIAVGQPQKNQLNRVSDDCGVLGGSGKTSHGAMSIILLFMPLAFVIAFRLKPR
ncbi:MAG: S8 family serine peptidase [Oligoflexales bacterium]